MPSVALAQSMLTRILFSGAVSSANWGLYEMSSQTRHCGLLPINFSWCRPYRGSVASSRWVRAIRRGRTSPSRKSFDRLEAAPPQLMGEPRDAGTTHPYHAAAPHRRARRDRRRGGVPGVEGLELHHWPHHHLRRRRAGLTAAHGRARLDGAQLAARIRRGSRPPGSHDPAGY